MRIEARVARLERIVQALLLALVEREDDPIVEIMPHKKPTKT
jgi:hypothetical protein